MNFKQKLFIDAIRKITPSYLQEAADAIIEGQSLIEARKKKGDPDQIEMDFGTPEEKTPNETPTEISEDKQATATTEVPAEIPQEPAPEPSETADQSSEVTATASEQPEPSDLADNTQDEITTSNTAKTVEKYNPSKYNYLFDKYLNDDIDVSEFLYELQVHPGNFVYNTVPTKFFRMLLSNPYLNKAINQIYKDMSNVIANSGVDVDSINKAHEGHATLSDLDVNHIFPDILLKAVEKASNYTSTSQNIAEKREKAAIGRPSFTPSTNVDPDLKDIKKNAISVLSDPQLTVEDVQHIENLITDIEFNKGDKQDINSAIDSAISTATDDGNTDLADALVAFKENIVKNTSILSNAIDIDDILSKIETASPDLIPSLVNNFNREISNFIDRYVENNQTRGDQDFHGNASYKMNLDRCVNMVNAEISSNEHAKKNIENEFNKVSAEFSKNNANTPIKTLKEIWNKTKKDYINRLEQINARGNAFQSMLATLNSARGTALSKQVANYQDAYSKYQEEHPYVPPTPTPKATEQAPKEPTEGDVWGSRFKGLRSESNNVIKYNPDSYKNQFEKGVTGRFMDNGINASGSVTINKVRRAFDASIQNIESILSSDKLKATVSALSTLWNKRNKNNNRTFAPMFDTLADPYEGSDNGDKTPWATFTEKMKTKAPAAYAWLVNKNLFAPLRAACGKIDMNGDKDPRVNIGGVLIPVTAAGDIANGNFTVTEEAGASKYDETADGTLDKYKDAKVFGDNGKEIENFSKNIRTYQGALGLLGGENSLKDINDSSHPYVKHLIDTANDEKLKDNDPNIARYIRSNHTIHNSIEYPKVWKIASTNGTWSATADFDVESNTVTISGNDPSYTEKVNLEDIAGDSYNINDTMESRVPSKIIQPIMNVIANTIV